MNVMERKKDPFRFGIMGAGNIARKFCDAVRQTEGCQVAAVASKSRERAGAFAASNQIPAAYGSYQEMLEQEQLDCVYIAVLPNDHYALSMLCLDHCVPVLCEKAMFMNSRQAEEVFRRSAEQGIFVMEAMWSRFLPPIRQAKRWLDLGEIGKVRCLDISIGFLAPEGKDNRYRNPALGGGAAYDITVYAYELADFMMGGPAREVQAAAVWGDTGVDLTDHVTLWYEDAVASLTTTFAAPMDEKLVLYGEKGKIYIPSPHFAKEAFLYGQEGDLREHFNDVQTTNGFVYEIREVMDCIRAGKAESETVPHSLTMACAQLFDQIAAKRTN